MCCFYCTFSVSDGPSSLSQKCRFRWQSLPSPWREASWTSSLGWPICQSCSIWHMTPMIVIRQEEWLTLTLWKLLVIGLLFFICHLSFVFMCYLGLSDTDAGSEWATFAVPQITVSETGAMANQPARRVGRWMLMTNDRKTPQPTSECWQQMTCKTKCEIGMIFLIVIRDDLLDWSDPAFVNCFIGNLLQCKPTHFFSHSTSASL